MRSQFEFQQQAVHLNRWLTRLYSVVVVLSKCMVMTVKKLLTHTTPALLQILQNLWPTVIGYGVKFYRASAFDTVSLCSFED
jgi:hypothetical protein